MSGSFESVKIVIVLFQEVNLNDQFANEVLVTLNQGSQTRGPRLGPVQSRSQFEFETPAMYLCYCC